MTTVQTVTVAKECFVEVDTSARCIRVGDDNRMNGLDFYAVLRTPADVDKLIDTLRDAKAAIVWAKP